MRYILGLLTLFVGIQSGTANAESTWLFIASPGKTPVIYASSLDLKTGAMSPLRVAAEDVSTGFMALHPTLPILYAGTSEKVAKGEPNGYVRAYRINADTGKLTLINKAPTNDRGTTHIQAAPNGTYVAVCHYGGSGTSIIPLTADGKLKQSVGTIAHKGSSVNPKRQTKPHPHGVAISEDGKFVCVADLGNDHVEVFEVDDNYQPHNHSFWKATPGAGPRHVTFHPNMKWLYSINELDSTISLLEFDPAAGALNELQTVSTLPEDFDGNNSTAELAITPDGKFLYGSNRGHNSTAAYAIDAKTGKLNFLEREPVQGDHPRFVGLDPSGTIYLSANRNTNNIVTFSIDAKTGMLEPTGHQLEVTAPMCVLFVSGQPD